VHGISIFSCLYFQRRSLSFFKSEQETDDPKIMNFELKREKIPGLLKISIFAGIFSGMLIGGGILFNSYLLEMGLTPESTSATMTLFLMIPFFMLMFTSIMAGRIAADELFWFMGLSMLGAFVISATLTYFAKKYKRQSILLISLCFVLSTVLIVVPTYGIAKVYGNPKSMLSFHSLCA